MNQLQLAIQYFNDGRLAEAETIARVVLENDPTSVVAYHLLGTIALRTNRIQHAVTHLSKAVELAPLYADAYRDLANALMVSGQADRAIETCKRLLAISSDDAMAYHNLGNALAVKGMYSEAKDAFLQAVRLNPGFARSACDLATALYETGDIAASVEWYGKSIALDLELDVAHAGLARSLAYLDDPKGAIRALCTALVRLPDSFVLRRSLSEMLDGYALPETGASERRILLDLLDDPNIPSQSLAVAVADVITASAGYGKVRRAVLGGGNIADALEQAELLQDPLLIAALPKLLLQSVEMERIFTAVRRACLLSDRADLPRPFLCALAQHCFLSEYVWQADESEEARLAELVGSLDSVLMEAPTAPAALETCLVKIVLYRPLYPLLSEIGEVRALAGMNWSLSFRNIVESQVIDTLHEKELADRIPCIADITDGTSIAVKKQYESNPYPRWMDCKLPAPGSFATVAAQWRPGEPIPETPDPLPVLDAGCGTGHSPIQAARMYHRCRVTAIDISKASLGYAARMAEEYRVSNIDFRCGDILKLGVLEERFAIILCGGVLHHLERPVEGWRVLTGLLAAGGLMRIALYSTYARTNVAAARALLADSVSGEKTLKEIRRCRQVILDLPDNHPAKTLIFSSDFRSASGFRDLVLHAREHTFTLPEVGQVLRELGLRFLGFELAPEMSGAYKQRYPQKGSETDLALWDKFEQEHPAVFAGMYQFWCSR